jgi:alkylhydroperoxidase/carboxymuconolactone decarboxylase family protein YurZ
MVCRRERSAEEYHGELSSHARTGEDSGAEMTDDAALREQTKKTAKMPRELSMFFAGKLYSREVISQKQRELCAVASLTVLHRPHELRAHIHAALNVGASRQDVSEVIFQQVTYGGMPVVVDALDVFKTVLEERGEWQD